MQKSLSKSSIYMRTFFKLKDFGCLRAIPQDLEIGKPKQTTSKTTTTTEHNQTGNAKYFYLVLFIVLLISLVLIAICISIYARNRQIVLRKTSPVSTADHIIKPSNLNEASRAPQSSLIQYRIYRSNRVKNLKKIKSLSSLSKLSQTINVMHFNSTVSLIRL